jgi:trehalose 6-phosphate phosphatase
LLNILREPHVRVLSAFADSNVLLAFDYDGTLAPITSQPASARMRVGTRRLLTSITARYPCVVISGRSRQDLAARLDGIPVWHLSGNHGIEPWGDEQHYPALVQRWTARLERQLAGYEGVVIEEKTYSITVHYRHTRNKRRAIEAIRTAVGELTGARAIGGIQAVSVLPSRAPHKGIAVERVRQLLACDSVIYVGDDETDEDAFRARPADRMLAIRIGSKRRSKARYGIESQREIDRLLRVLLKCRPMRRGLVAGSS